MTVYMKKKNPVNSNSFIDRGGKNREGKCNNHRSVLREHGLIHLMIDAGRSRSQHVRSG